MELNMKKKNISMISFLLAMIMTLGVLASCQSNPADTVISDTAADTESVTEAPTSSGESENNETGKNTDGKETEKATEKGTEKGDASETEETLDTSALELEIIDYAPSYKEYESMSSYNEEPVNVRVEAENYIYSSIPWNPVKGSEFSNGVLMKALVTGENNLSQGAQGQYEAHYTVTVPKTGEYNLMALAGTNNADYTTDFKLVINNKDEIYVSEAEIVGKFESPTLNDNGLVKYMNMGKINLEAGENTIRYVVLNSDFNSQWGIRISTFFDYLEISNDTNTEAVIELSYDVSLKGVENSEILAAAAKVNVFDRRFPIKISFSKFFDADGIQNYEVVDYFGNTVISGYITGTQFDHVSIDRTMKNHPTGYFKFIMGDVSVAYVVTPALDERKYTDSPFAMDFASYYHASDINDMVSLASAARLSGVTWVRDRSHWSSYEATQGKYTFNTDKRFNAIKKAGLNLLTVFYVSPEWAKESLGKTEFSVGGFADTQLEVYNMMKALTEHYSGVVDAWEIWNESDGGFAGETAEQYTAWFKAASLGAIAGDPNVIVAHGGYCIPNEHNMGTDASGNIMYSDYIHLSLMNDLLDYSSVFNYHSHTPQSEDLHIQDYRTIAFSKYIYPTMALYEAFDKPVWVTEAGMRMLNEAPSTEILEAQAPYIVSSTVQSLGMGTDKHYWFLLAPYTENGGDFGTFSKDLKPYPTLAAEAVMTQVLGKAEYLGELPGVAGSEHIGPFSAVFNAGTRYVSVLWMRAKTSEYTFKSDLPVIITDMMGNETLVEPVNGEITVTITEDPIYITYSTPPAYYGQNEQSDEMENLEFTFGDKIVLSPEFANFDINDTLIKANGHVVSNGLKVKVRVSNFNDTPITGTVNATLEGFTVEGCDKEVTVQPYSEAFVTLTLKRNGDAPVNGYMIFKGTFNGEETSQAAAHVYTKGAERMNSTFKFFVTLAKNEVEIEDAKVYVNKVLSDIKIKVDGNMKDGEAIVMLDESRVENAVYDPETGEIKVDLSGISEGNYYLTVAMMDETGYCDFAYMYVFYHEGKVIFRNIHISYKG